MPGRVCCSSAAIVGLLLLLEVCGCCWGSAALGVLRVVLGACCCSAGAAVAAGCGDAAAMRGAVPGACAGILILRRGFLRLFRVVHDMSGEGPEGFSGSEEGGVTYRRGAAGGRREAGVGKSGEKVREVRCVW